MGVILMTGITGIRAMERWKGDAPVFPELVIPTSIGHLCGAALAAGKEQKTEWYRFSRRGEVEPFHAMDILAEANRLKARGAPVISMAVGQPPIRRRAAVRGSAALALHDGRIGYTDALGTAVLREAIAGHYRDHYGVDVPHERIAFVTTGSSAAFNLAFLAMFDAGDAVAIASPGYPAYRNIMAALGLDVVEVEMEEAPISPPRQLAAAHARKTAAGAAVRQPCQPHRRGRADRRDGGASGRSQAPRHLGHLRRDLSSAELFADRTSPRCRSTTTSPSSTPSRNITA